MGAANLDLQIEQGATFSRTLTLKDAQGVKLDLTGWTFRGQVRTSLAAVSSLAAFTFAIANQITNPGEVSFSLSDVTTSGLPVTQPSDPSRPETVYIYDIEAVDDSLVVYRLLQGQVYVSPEVTR